MRISLISLGKEVECYLVFPKRIEANFVPQKCYILNIAKETFILMNIAKCIIITSIILYKCIISLQYMSLWFFFFFFLIFFFFFIAKDICSIYVSQTSFFSNFFIKNMSHDTIYTFKNYFATIFLVFNFQLYPNGPIQPTSSVTKLQKWCRRN